MSNPQSFVQDMDDLQYRLFCGVELVWAVHECIEHGDHAPEEYDDALFGAYSYLRGLCAEMKKTVETKLKAGRGDAR